ncbi:MAG: sulfatase-like hydrolase/transferase, partial [Candidatus Krumholzibacteria bacterium]|nr:sulfatase-like hydrolase/transferase [Candidatus Krumholzibacteria bacterium]
MALVLNVPLICSTLLLDMRHVDFTRLTWVYISCVFIGYYVFPLLFVITLIFLFFFPLRRVAVYCSGAIITIFVYYLLLDYFTYNIIKIHINFFWLGYIFNDYSGLGLPTSTLHTLLVALLGIIAVEIGIFTFARRVRKPKHLILTFSLLTILAFGVSQVIHIVAYQRNDNRITSLTHYLPAYIPFTSHKNAVKYGGLLPIGETEPGVTSKEYQYSSLNYPLSDMKYSAPPGKKLPNIVIILLESWRFDMMNDTASPNIFALSQKSSVFLKHFSSGNQTTCGIFGLFYGLHPTYWTAVKANNALINNPVLIDVLKKNQYIFGIYAKSKFERHKIKDTIFRGIEVHESFSGKSIPDQDKDLTRQLISFLHEQTGNQRPFMALAFFKSSHCPYCYPEAHAIFRPAKEMNLAFTSDGTAPEYYLNDYRNSIHYVDALVGEIVQQLESLGALANTVIIVTTDHGEEFNDNKANYWGHGSNFTQYQTLVPLIIYFPDKEPQRITHATSHIDIAPTLLQDFFGCTSNIRDYSNGRNLFAKQTGLRPLVIGSYFNHALIIEDSVYEIYPLYTRKYKLNDITLKAS